MRRKSQSVTKQQKQRRESFTLNDLFHYYKKFSLTIKTKATFAATKLKITKKKKESQWPLNHTMGSFVDKRNGVASKGKGTKTKNFHTHQILIANNCCCK